MHQINKSWKRYLHVDNGQDTCMARSLHTFIPMFPSRCQSMYEDGRQTNSSISATVYRFPCVYQQRVDRSRNKETGNKVECVSISTSVYRARHVCYFKTPEVTANTHLCSVAGRRWGESGGWSSSGGGGGGGGVRTLFSLRSLAIDKMSISFAFSGLDREESVWSWQNSFGCDRIQAGVRLAVFRRT